MKNKNKIKTNFTVEQSSSVMFVLCAWEESLEKLFSIVDSLDISLDAKADLNHYLFVNGILVKNFKTNPIILSGGKVTYEKINRKN